MIYIHFLIGSTLAFIDRPKPLNSPNSQIQYLFGIPLERVQFFSLEDSSETYESDDPDDGGEAAQSNFLTDVLLPDWMRDDLNEIASDLYLKFQNEADLSHLDSRDAEAIIREFSKFQLDYLRINNDTMSFWKNRDSLRQSFFGFQTLLAKIGTDFANKMGFEGGTKNLYSARLHAEVFGSGDAVSPQSAIQSGAVASGVVFTNLPPTTIGSSFFELMDPRGHNPPFGKDEKIKVYSGAGLLYPAWLTRFVPPHRHPKLEAPLSRESILSSHRIDWIFEIGLFQYRREVLSSFVDFEKCPFQDGFRMIEAQVFFNLDVEQLVGTYLKQ